jgi:transcriptional regulator with GAF, ATPase, and Fis domain
MNAYPDTQPVAAWQQRILIVEDEFIIADRLRTILEKLGYANVGMVHAVATALAVLRETPFDLVLLDINLKDDRDGIGLAREIRLRYGLPFVYITAYVDEQTMAQAEASHPYGYVVKPFKPADIQAAVQLAHYRQAYEQISRQEQERRLLLDVSTAIATIRDKEDLFHIIASHLKPVLAFEEAYVAVPLPGGNTYRVLMAEATGQCRSANQSVGVTDETCSHIPAYKQVVALGQPVLFKPGDPAAGSVQMNQNAPLATHFQTQFSLGIPLRYASNVVGGLFLLAPENVFDVQKYSFYQVIADQVAVAVANILANEEILEREREKTILYNIAKCLATVKDKMDLLGFIFREVQPLFRFYDLGLLVLNAGKHCYQDWSALYPQISPSQVNFELHRESLHTYPLEDALTGHVFERLQKAGRPVIVDFNEFVERAFDYAALETEVAHGIKEGLVAVLQVRGKVIGWLNLNSTAYNHFKESDIPLFQAIADQVAVAVANILANEEILEREREKTALLSIAEAIARIQNRKELLRVIYDTIQPVYPFDSAGLFITDAEKDLCYELLDGETFPDGIQTQLTAENQLGPWKLSLYNPKSWWMQEGIVIGSMAQEAAYAVGTPSERQFELGLAYGLRHMIGGPLFANGKKIGALCFNSKREGFFADTSRYLFKSISDQIGVAVANILANEEILQREREKVTLLSISSDIASARNTVELLSVIRERAQQLIPFYDTGILIVEPDKQYHYDLAVRIVGWDSSEVNQRLQAVSVDRVPHQDSHLAAVIQKIEAGNMPLIEDWDLAFTQFNDPFFPIIQQSGIKEAIVTTLKSGGKTIGTLWLNSKAKEHFHPKQFEIFQALADQVAVAVANILANEQILEREREKATLLSISEQLATIRDKHDLFAVIFEKLKPIFKFDDAVVVLYDALTHSTQHFTHIHAYDIDRSLAEGYQKIFTQKILVANTPYEELIDLDRPCILTMEYLLQKYPGHIGVQTAKAFGLTQHVFMPLRYGGQLLGFFEFHAKAKNRFSEEQTPLFRNVADQVAVAVANILANEEIVEREREKSLLLNVSETIATVRDKDALFAVLMDKIKPLVRFDNNATIFLFDKEKMHYTFWLHKLYQASSATAEFEAWTQRKTPVSEDPLAQFLITHRRPVIIPIGEAIEKFPEQTGVQWAKQVGLKQALHVPLQVGGELIGFLSFDTLTDHAFTEAQFPLVQSVADQVAVAVANILANEEILEREREKTQLLKVSEAISTIRDAHSLFSSLSDIIRSIIAFDDAPMIFLLDEQSQYYRIFYSKVFDPSANLSSLGAWQQGNNPVATDPIATYLIGQNRTLVMNVKQALEQWGDFPGKQTMLDLALAECLVAPLRVNDRLSGFLCVWSRSEGKFDIPKLNLFQAIADQVAVAVANILANEEILRREREKALQVAVIHALAQEGSWEDKFLRLTRVLQKHIPFDYLYLVLEKNKLSGRRYACLRIGFDEYQTIDADSFCRMTGISVQKYLTMHEQRVYAGPELLQGEAFEKAAARYALPGLLARTFELESGIAIPLKLSHQGRFVLNVLAKKPHGLTPGHLALLEKLSAPLALTLENLLAYEEIKGLKERLEVEKEYLEDEINVNYKFEDIIGASQSLKEVFKKVSQVAMADSTVLVLGETGTGKELVARAIHNLSKRSDRALVKINCAALPAQLIESELFGHEKGAFTGALDRRIGKFELAHGSTIFLDEVGELPLELQAKLLRAIQEKEVERLGGNKIVKTDVRIIAATNRNLEQEVAQGRFRADLYFRLNVFPITLPPLRDRKEDIPLLAVHFIRKMGKKLGKNITGISNAAIKEMQAYNWPGNIRELEHFIERAAITSTGIISELGLPDKDSDLVAFPVGGHVQQTLAQNERALIMETLKRCDGRIRGKGGAAELLDIEANTLDARMKKLGIVRKQTFGSAV